MAKRKLQRFADVETFDNVAKPTTEQAMQDSFPLKGKWHKEFFKNENPIVLELACGKGEYTVGLAKNYPGKNFIGVDIKGNRLWHGAKYALENKMTNVGFLRTRIDFITQLFAEGEISEIWITFADPQKERPRKRLTGEMFLNRYRKIMKSGGKVNLKCDSDLLYEFTKEVVAAGKLKVEVDSANIYEELVPSLGDAPLAKDLEIKTYYERRWLSEGKKIKFISFIL
ncbi:MAG: tRNA (guanosine(46)-N7)-methyltransferase TrmB [Bacteroidetes bacterium]|nr:tRNA (guanosine(46)-N7)-methyltransferase TrmB [Bacteroidota bacterium]